MNVQGDVTRIQKASGSSELDPIRWNVKQEDQHLSPNASTAKHEEDAAKEQVVLNNKTQGVKGQLDRSLSSQWNFKLFYIYVLLEKNTYWSVFCGRGYQSVLCGRKRLCDKISWGKLQVNLNKSIFCRNILRALNGNYCFSNLSDHGALLLVKYLLGLALKKTPLQKHWIKAVSGGSYLWDSLKTEEIQTSDECWPQWP